MLFDSRGNPIPPAPLVQPRDQVFDSRVEQQGYQIPAERMPSPDFADAARSEVERLRQALETGGRMDGMDPTGVNLDAFANELTGIGTQWGDKTRGGLPGGPAFNLCRMSGIESEYRARGSDLGRNIVEKIPDEMTREGWDVEVQPSEEDAEIAKDPAAHLDSCLRDPRRAAAGWRKMSRSPLLSPAGRATASYRAQRWDFFAATAPNSPGTLPPTGTVAPTAPPPGPLPKINDEGIELSEAMEKWAEALNVVGAVNQAMRYERCFGGGCVFIGVDDGNRPLTEPINPDAVKNVTHLTAFSGGWDGEAVMWRPYNNGWEPKFGYPEIFQMRNTSVQLARPPAPGEGPVRQLIPQGPSGPTIWYVHESRLMIFDGEPVSRQAQQEMRGWGDSVFTRVNDVLSQYEQTWNAVAILMQEFSVATLAIKGLSRALAEKGTAARQAFMDYARFQALVQSVARMRFVDADETFTRVTASVAGVAEILREYSMRLAAASDMPVSLLMGQVKGGLGDAGNTDVRFFYDRIASKQLRRLHPQLHPLYRLGWKAKNSPTRGVEPSRWALKFRPLWQSTAAERADVRLKTTQADQIEITSQVVTPEEVTATRYGGPVYNDGPIVLDLEGRAGASARSAPGAAPGPAAPAEPAPTDLHAAAEAAREANADPLNDPGAAAAAAAPPAPSSGAASVPVPPMTAMRSDPITGDPTSQPSKVTATDAAEAFPEEDEITHEPAGGPTGGQFAAGAGGGSGVSGPASIEKASLGQIAVRLTRLANAGRGHGDPEYGAIVKELKTRGIKSFGALERAVAKE